MRNQNCYRPQMLEPEAFFRFLNDNCACDTLDRVELDKSLNDRSTDTYLLNGLAQTHPHLFSHTPVYVSHRHFTAMKRTVSAIERVSRMPAYQSLTLARSNKIAAIDQGPVGALMGYDFHLDSSGPQLIEVNTNAGGALLSSALYGAQKNCCDNIPATETMLDPKLFEKTIIEMFGTEWRRQRLHGQPKTLALVDSDPEQQYLYPEFELMRNLLQRAGWETVIADSTDFEYDGNKLKLSGTVIDMVYNRLVDFDLSQPAHEALRGAYESGSVVVTPNPRNHALLADKRNLTVLTSRQVLKQIGISEEDRETLYSTIPDTQIVDRSNHDALWANRKNLFFKPAAGHGSRAVYRGDKLTRRVWSEVKSGTYVAQKRVSPSTRIIRWGDETIDPIHHKVDIRLYTYEGHVLVAAARLYQGQTTNFRTPAGGFAPIFVV